MLSLKSCGSHMKCCYSYIYKNEIARQFLYVVRMLIKSEIAWFLHTLIRKRIYKLRLIVIVHVSIKWPDLKSTVKKCAKCSEIFLSRHKVFNSENRLEHIPGTGEDFLSWNDKLITEEHKKLSSSYCTSYFIEPLPWMDSLLVGTVEGKV